MNIEEEIFRKSKVNFNKIKQYGFKEENDYYVYSKKIMNNTFRMDVKIDKRGNVIGKIFDLSYGDEYTNFRLEDGVGAFVGQVRHEFTEILKNIKDKCFDRKMFVFDQSNQITQLIKEKYGDDPSFEWETSPGHGVFKNSDSKKWYGIIMNINKSKLDDKYNESVEVMNIKLDPNEILMLLKRNGFYPAYHMNKKYWITIILDNTISNEEIMKLVDKSYLYTIKNKSNEWLIPANPKYFDIEKALSKNTTINWKQSTDIKIKDIIYLYVAQPYSSIMYKFEVIDTNIPYEGKREELNIKKIMKIRLLKRYEKGKYSFEKLKEYGVNAVRGPRYMPIKLREYINKN